MRREIDEPIIAAFNEFAAKHLPDDLPDDTDVPLLVTFKLGEIRRLKRHREHMDNGVKAALGG